MRVEILGSAAGGGFPQWNCACRNCGALRAGTFSGKARTQLQVAIGSDGRSWFLLNASPDLRAQIEASSFLHPHGGPRQSSISGVVLTTADLDQALGLLLLRELQPLRIFATPSIRSVLRDDNSMFAMLHRTAQQAQWTDIVAGSSFPLITVAGEQSGIRCLPIPMASRYPSYVAKERAAALKAEEALLGLIVETSSGGRLAYLPTVPRVDDNLLRQLETVDVLLFDGTFWTDDELIQVQGDGQTARQMGHIPVSSPEGSMQLLAGLHHPRKIFVHVNNTNPMLDESGPEYHQVREAGWEVAEDGWHFEL
jgi:pyrroloquinoline quinone biosynthesis protein B